MLQERVESLKHWRGGWSACNLLFLLASSMDSRSPVLDLSTNLEPADSECDIQLFFLEDMDARASLICWGPSERIANYSKCLFGQRSLQLGFIKRGRAAGGCVSGRWHCRVMVKWRKVKGTSSGWMECIVLSLSVHKYVDRWSLMKVEKRSYY